MGRWRGGRIGRLHRQNPTRSARLYPRQIISYAAVLPNLLRRGKSRTTGATITLVSIFLIRETRRFDKSCMFSELQN